MMYDIRCFPVVSQTNEAPIVTTCSSQWGHYNNFMMSHDPDANENHPEGLDGAKGSPRREKGKHFLLLHMFACCEPMFPYKGGLIAIT